MIPNLRALELLAVGFALGYVWANWSDISGAWRNRQQINQASQTIDALREVGVL